MKEDVANLERMKLSFAILSFAFLFVMAIAPAKNYFREWKVYQKDYYKLLDAKKGSKSKKQRHPIKINQIWNKDLGLVDRCTTCHLGVEEPLMADAERVEFRMHSQTATTPWNALSKHPIGKFGCTTCHQGQGRATTKEAAHGYVEHWERPMFRGKFIEAACGRCHKARELKEAPTLTKGRELIVKYGCVGCHVIGRRGLTIGPELTEVASKDLNGDHKRNDKDWKWMLEHFESPPDAWKSIVKDESEMPEFTMPIKFTKEDAEALTVAMLTFTGEKIPEEYKVPAPPEPKPKSVVERGKLIFEEFGCAGCHGVGGTGHVKNPNAQGGEVPAIYKLADTIVNDKEEADKLIDMLQKGVKLDPEKEPWLKDFFKIQNRLVDGKKPEKADPHKPSPPLYMPSFKEKIKGDDLNYLVAYVISLFPEDAWENWDEE